MRWLSRNFNINACVYQIATGWDIYHLIELPFDWLIDDAMFVSLLDDLILGFFIQQFDTVNRGIWTRINYHPCITSQYHPCITTKWHWQVCFKVRLVQLFPSDTGRIIPKWELLKCFQVILPQLFLSKNGTVTLKWDWLNCSCTTLVELFPIETAPTLPKWDCQNCSWVTLCEFSQVRLAQFF